MKNRLTSIGSVQNVVHMTTNGINGWNEMAAAPTEHLFLLKRYTIEQVFLKMFSTRLYGIIQPRAAWRRWQV